MILIGESVTRVNLRNTSLSEIVSTQWRDLARKTRIKISTFMPYCDGNDPVPK